MATTVLPLVAEVKYTRQQGIVKPDQLQFPITVIGAGGIGSPTAMLLGKMGCNNLTVWDFDTIEPHNLPNQMYRHNQVGRIKVDALAENIREYAGAMITQHPNRFRSDSGLVDVVVVAVDSMTARKEVWNHVLRNKPKLLIDGRMGGEGGMVLTADPRDKYSRDQYIAMLYDDADAVQDTCTARAVIYNTFYIAALIGKVVQLYATGQRVPQTVAFDMTTFNNIIEK